MIMAVTGRGELVVAQPGGGSCTLQLIHRHVDTALAEPAGQEVKVQVDERLACIERDDRCHARL